MARKVITTRSDDLTGETSENVSTHSILVDGAGVEIDLDDENYEALLALLNPYLQATGARRVRGVTVSRKGGARRAEGPKKAGRPSGTSSAIRSWARANGFEVSDRGRMPASVHQAYERAHA
ncbi:Lsr2 family protein [Streptomyces sp. NPDC047028]|uniref:histone-like nucleoid-structuring protein Lsr2 n=1 Tax=Streptomyces sp. NPDC047028 TaxID=3155793 RepID=UPI0033DADCDE